MSDYMRRALELAKRGDGSVSPNPMVGCVIVKDEKIVGEGWHEIYGGPHAEVNALKVAGENAKGATAYVTLEPCCHVGKTGPCTDALIAAGVANVVAAMRDPNPKVAGKGFDQLRKAGIPFTLGVCGEEARELNIKYLTRLEKNRPWIVAKWAMTLDGKIASKTASSQWVSSDASQLVVHQLRGQMDAIMVGSRTALKDDPFLTVRLSEKPPRRPPLRIVLDSTASLPLESRLVQTAREAPLLIGIDAAAPLDKVKQLETAGCEIIVLPGRLRSSSANSKERVRARDSRPGSPENRLAGDAEAMQKKRLQEDREEFHKSRERFLFLFAELARRSVTTLFVEGGGTVLGSLFDAKLVDEAHVFIAPKFLGGRNAISPVAGLGIPEMSDALPLLAPTIEFVGPDIYVHGRVG